MRVAAILLAAAAACRASSGGDAADADAPAPGFSTDAPDASIGARAGRVLLASCSGGPESSCHVMGAGGMTIPGADLVGVPSTERPDLVRVKPFAPEESYLHPGSAAVLLGWIEAGAP